MDEELLLDSDIIREGLNETWSIVLSDSFVNVVESPLSVFFSLFKLGLFEPAKLGLML